MSSVCKPKSTGFRKKNSRHKSLILWNLRHATDGAGRLSISGQYGIFMV